MELLKSLPVSTHDLFEAKIQFHLSLSVHFHFKYDAFILFTFILVQDADRIYDAFVLYRFYRYGRIYPESAFLRFCMG